MFYLIAYTTHQTNILGGLVALDERRRLRLKDGTNVSVKYGKVEMEVGEGFARLYPECFTNYHCYSFAVPLSALCHDEVEEFSNGTIILSSLSLERIKDLFIKYREKK